MGGGSKTLKEGPRRMSSVHLRSLPGNKKILGSPVPHIVEQS